ncbi:MAG: hypothetical protein K5837_03795 [Candidatus Saccharibacteria bacterium]|nr:hypothetical protein [Candidatus Saccharibacteria bacterium]
MKTIDRKALRLLAITVVLSILGHFRIRGGFFIGGSIWIEYVAIAAVFILAVATVGLLLCMSIEHSKRGWVELLFCATCGKIIGESLAMYYDCGRLAVYALILLHVSASCTALIGFCGGKVKTMISWILFGAGLSLVCDYVLYGLMGLRTGAKWLYFVHSRPAVDYIVIVVAQLIVLAALLAEDRVMSMSINKIGMCGAVAVGVVSISASLDEFAFGGTTSLAWRTVRLVVLLFLVLLVFLRSDTNK